MRDQKLNKAKHKRPQKAAGRTSLSLGLCWRRYVARWLEAMKDKHGLVVQVGDLVRVLEINDGFLKMLPDDERLLHEAMLNNIYEVDEIVEGSTKASVSFLEGNT